MDDLPDGVEPPKGAAPPERGGSPLPADPPYQSLYRRFRPQRFADVKGQDHVIRALVNTVRDGHVAHAYLFSGPRGTGKTSTARILAMALNCAHPVDGEPDGTCPSCVDIRRGVSTDVHELDAASNRRIDEMRDLLSRVALGTRGRWKVYIIDEVHQLTADAASALLKTLEEPPAHVVFVLATTDPQKVLPTIRSRTIHFDFHLLPSEVLGDLLRDVNQAAGLGVPPEAIDLVVRRGHGSARDALTVLDQVAAGGGVEDGAQMVSQIVDGLAERDAGMVLIAVAEGMAAGRDARRLAADLLDHLRNAFLATMARGLVMLPDDAVTELAEQARRLGLAALVRAMEVIGQALADMRDSVDPRVSLEVALVRLTRPDADASPAALLERIERLERGARGGHEAGAGVGGAGSGGAAPRLGERGAPPGPPGGSSGRTHLPPPPPMPGGHAGPAAPVPGGAGTGPKGTGPSEPGPSGPGPNVAGSSGAAASSLPAPGSPRPAPLEPPAASPRLGPPPPIPAASVSAPQAPQPSPGGARGSAPASPSPPLFPEAAVLPSAPDPPGPALARARARGAGPGTPPPLATRAAAGAGAAGAAGVAPGSGAPLPSRDELTLAWGDGVLRGLSLKAKAYLANGRFVSVGPDGAVFALPNQQMLGRSLDTRPEAEAALAARFGRPVPLRLVVESATAAEPAVAKESDESEEPLDHEDLDHLQDAKVAVISPEQRLMDAFPGAEEVST